MSEELDTAVYYKTSKGEWRWRRVAPNGEIVGASSEGYKNWKDCQANLERQRKACILDVE